MKRLNKSPLWMAALLSTSMLSSSNSAWAQGQVCTLPTDEGFADLRSLASKIVDITQKDVPAPSFWHPFNNLSIGSRLVEQDKRRILEMVRMSFLKHSGLPSDVNLSNEERAKIASEIFSQFAEKELQGSNTHKDERPGDTAKWINAQVVQMQRQAQIQAIGLLKEKQTDQVVAQFKSRPGIVKNRLLLDDEYAPLVQAVAKSFSDQGAQELEKAKNGTMTQADLLRQLRTMSNNPQKNLRYEASVLSQLQAETNRLIAERAARLSAEADRYESNPTQGTEHDHSINFPGEENTEGAKYIRQLLTRTDLDASLKKDPTLWNEWLNDSRLQRNYRENRAYHAMMARGATLQDLLKEWSGVWENFSIGEHEGRVINIYNAQKQYYNLKFVNLPKEVRDIDRLFKVMMGFHDIGKSIAVHAGNKDLQDDFNTPLLERYMAADGFNPSEVALASALVDNDALGNYLKKQTSKEKTASIIREQAKKAGMNPNDFFVLQQLFYTCDSASYPGLTQLVYGAKSGHEMDMAYHGKLKIKNPAYKTLAAEFGGDPLTPPPPAEALPDLDIPFFKSFTNNIFSELDNLLFPKAETPVAPYINK